MRKSLQSIAKFKRSAPIARLNVRQSALQLLRSKFPQTIILAALVVSMSACNSLPKPSKTVMGNAGSAQGQWRGKAFVLNLKTGKSATLDLEMAAQEPDRLRIEALGPFSVHVASIVAKGPQVLISLSREKKFLKAPADRYALAKIVPVRVAPSDLLAILFERNLEENNSGWKCTGGEPPQWTCQSGTATVARQTDDDGRRRYQFSAPDARMDLVIAESKSDIAAGDAAYELTPPPGFKIEERH